MKRLGVIIDSISDWTGKTVRWLCVALILVAVWDVTLRYIFNAPTIWSYETSLMLGGTISVLGFSYVHRHHGHIRVDVFYARLTEKGKQIIDVLFASVFTMPLCIALTSMAFSWMLTAWARAEVMAETSWYPPSGPFRTIVFIGLFLFSLQALAQLVRDFQLLVRGGVASQN
ncbi:TRAP transporter small permease subunit [Chloroflexota bacterium]